MGLIGGLLNIVFGNDRNVVKETVEVFRANAEEGAARAQELRLQALNQHGREFESANDSAFNRLMDGVNRIPRPALALGTLGLFLAAMVDPIWFAARMQGIALVPEPLWWLLGVVVSFYFGARHQVKSQQFQQSIAKSVALAPKVVENIGMLQSLRATTPGSADTAGDVRLKTLALQPDGNAALEEWQSAVKTPATK
ncbi:carboxylesterase [Roseobacter denitrificans]|uniref:Carboxylesterase n=1 Tax=Roseobacter denitrificans (strain ATCC 33942 / OCh 114) TaxID=375451 RepID=Q163W7_ROSDO|nr:holin family protein [Roseobacter denitrificans]ABG32726.1 hypothetical protein RD1_3224 [Roseobacter denitrificans OCh 114]AVL52147.1 carboxylesterase [Roseobacter denitrificans]SFF94217.1 Holin of 3TMs, for gene-transfer release [Roseobacter denitrificans OCh 114]